MSDITGREFDWFAIDADGNVGLFASGGSGQAPKVVLDRYEDYDDVAGLIAHPNWGTTDVWKDCANLGFFVFETNFNGGAFVKRGEPLNKMAEELRGKILGIQGLPRFEVSFPNIKSLEDFDNHI